MPPALCSALRCAVRSAGWNWRIAALAIGAVVLVWIAAGIILAGRNVGPPPNEQQTVSLFGGKVVGNRIRTKSWTFEYRKAQLSPDGVLASVDGLEHGVLYNKGKPYLGITAKHVQVNTQTFDFTAMGDVHVEQLRPKDDIRRTFYTDLVSWTNASKQLTLPHPSIVRSGDQTLRVASVTVDFNKQDVHLGTINGGFSPP